jgi:transcriptional regulator with XRE-family HTH domain
MKLSDYLAMANKSAATFAAELGISVSAVNFWRTGERTPRITQMQKIYEATNGAVTPNDFLPLPFRGESQGSPGATIPQAQQAQTSENMKGAA